MLPLGSAGVVASACLYMEINETRETLSVRGRVSQPELREEQAGPARVADRLVLVMKPGNSGGAKEPDFWQVTGRDQESGDWPCLSTPFSDSEVTERTVLNSEDAKAVGFTTDKRKCRVLLGEANRKAGCGKSARPV